MRRVHLKVERCIFIREPIGQGVFFTGTVRINPLSKTCTVPIRNSVADPHHPLCKGQGGRRNHEITISQMCSPQEKSHHFVAGMNNYKHDVSSNCHPLAHGSRRVPRAQMCKQILIRWVSKLRT